MKKLLNLGVSDPLTLGMAHPIADRLETLGRARPTTWGGRVLALSAMGVLAIASAPLTIAADAPEVKNLETKHKYVSRFLNDEGLSYEIITEDGERKAYRILDNGDREPAQFETTEDGKSRVVFSDGQIEDLLDIDLSKIESLDPLVKLEGFKALEGVDVGTAQIRVVNTHDGTELPEDFKLQLPESIRNLIDSNGGIKQVKFVRSGDGTVNFEDIADRTVDFQSALVGESDVAMQLKITFEDDGETLASARRQLELTKRQIEKMTGDEDLTFDLENALRDLENARKSLEAAESRLTGETE